jgi:PAS domain S-box-containing protein
MEPEFYREIFESLRCGILTIDEEGNVTTVNQVARQILDLPEDIPEKTPCHALFSQYPEICRILLDSLRMENPPSRFELDLKTPGHLKLVIGGSISHVRGISGAREGAVLFFKDLTTIEQGEEQERLKDRLAALGNMAAGLAHEIRNPLGNIGTTASLLKRKLSGNDSGIVALDNIVQEVRRLNHTVTQCLEYAKPVHLRPHRVALPTLVSEALQEVRAKWPAGKVEVKESHDPGVQDLSADGIQLRQVLHNLISNAYDAMGGKGRLEIGTYLEPGTTGHEYRSGQFAVIRIRDTGRGISQEVRERLFLPFFTTKPGGSGIGLAIAKKIIDSHQGMIDVESEAREGATFVVKLPYPGITSVPFERHSR